MKKTHVIDCCLGNEKLNFLVFMKVGQRIFDSTQQIYPRRLSSGNQAFNTFMTEVPIILKPVH